MTVFMPFTFLWELLNIFLYIFISVAIIRYIKKRVCIQKHKKQK